MPDAPDPVPGSAKGVRWDLSQLFPDAGSARREWDLLLADAGRFRDRWQGWLAELDDAAVSELLLELGGLVNRIDGVRSYCLLRAAADSRDGESQDLEGLSDRSSVEFDNRTRFFELEWKGLAPEAAARLASSPRLAGVRHWLERLTEEAAHSLGAAEERALAERSPAATAAWQQLVDQTVAAISVDFSAGSEPARPHTVQQMLAYQFDARAEVRQRAEAAAGAARQPWAGVLAKAYDALVGDRLALDRLRGYVGPDQQALPMQQANRANDLSDASVSSMIDAVEEHYPLAQRYFRVKAGLLGLPRLRSADVSAPLGRLGPCDYQRARRLVLEAVARFSPEAEQILGRFFTEARIDAEPRAGKRGGAFCEDVAQDRPAFLLLSFTDSIQDAGVLAHELGHGLHAALAQREQSPFTMRTGMAMAEVASTFNELLFFDHLMDREQDAAARRVLTGVQIERSCLTIFRQVMMARYEQLAYAAKARGESLGPGRLAQIWGQVTGSYYGDSVEVSPDARWSWSTVPHFIHTRFYTYSYAFAHLVSLALYSRYRERGQAFVPEYFRLLAAGSSRAPGALLAECGIDILDPRWVEPPLAVIEGWVDQLAAAAGSA